MKKIIVLLITLSFSLINFSQQSNEELIIRLQCQNIKVYRNWTHNYVEITCRLYCHHRLFPTRGYIFGLQTLGIFENLDSCYQLLYDWIKDIEDFGLTHIDDDSTAYGSAVGFQIYHSAHKNYIIIPCPLMSEEAPFCSAHWTLEAIIELKRQIVEYAKEHNIRINL